MNSAPLMKRNLCIGLSALIAVAFTAFAYQSQRAVHTEPHAREAPPPVAQASSSPLTSSASEAEEPVPFESSLADVLASGKGYGCHYKESQSGAEVIGTVFVSQGRARGTFIANNMMERDGLLWYFLLKQGYFAVWFVLPDDAPSELRGRALLMATTSPERVLEGRVDIEKALPDLYGCIPWEFEPGFFELPSDIRYVSQEELEEYEEGI